MSVRLDSESLEHARAVRIEHEIARRGIRLKRVASHELAGACLACGGRDRFSVNTNKKIWNCRVCKKAGDVIALVQHLDGVPFADACRMLAGEPSCGIIPQKVRNNPAPRRAGNPAPAKPATGGNPPVDNRARALAIWHEAVPAVSTLAEQYLNSRALDVPYADAMRFHAQCPFQGEKHPALVALWRDIRTDEPVAIHRRALKPNTEKHAEKHPVHGQKWKALGPTAGAAIKLSPHADVSSALHIAEGPETALASMLLGFRPMWVAGSCGAISNFPVLAGIDCLTIIVDNDPHDEKGRRAGQDAAARCVETWTQAGRRARTVTPNIVGHDMADVVEMDADDEQTFDATQAEREPLEPYVPVDRNDPLEEKWL